MERLKPRYRPHGKDVIPASMVQPGETIIVYPRSHSRPFEATVVSIKSFTKNFIKINKKLVPFERGNNVIVKTLNRKMSIGDGTAVLNISNKLPTS